MDKQTIIELDLDEAYNDFDIINIELQTACWEDRLNKLNLKKSILHNIRKLNDRLNRIEELGR